MKTTTTKKKVLFFIPTFPVLTETFIEKEVLKLEDSILDTYKCNSKSSKKTYNNNLKVYKEVSLMLIHKDLLNENKIKNIINFVKKNKIDYI